MASASLVFRSFREGDEHAILRLLNEHSEVDCSLDEWAWSFPFQAGGRAIIVGEEDGEVAAVCAGVRLRMVVDGREWSVLDIQRLASRDRAGARRALEHVIESPGSTDRFALLITSLDLDREGLTGFTGMQSDRALMLERRGVAASGPRRLLYRAEPIRDWEPRLDRLWQRVRVSYPVAVVRDADRGLHRFAGHPRIRHHRFLVLPRVSSDPVAAAVFTVEGSRCRWLDLIWDHDHPGALDLLCHISGRLAREFQADVEQLWMIGDEAASGVLSGRGFRYRMVPSRVAAYAIDPQIDARAILDRVYLTSADLGAVGR